MSGKSTSIGRSCIPELVPITGPARVVRGARPGIVGGSLLIARSSVALGPLTTLRIGGPAQRFADIDREDEVVDAVRQADAHQLPLFVLGEGSNVVVGDEGFSGLAAGMRTRGTEARRAGDRVIVDVAAGEPWDDLVARSVDEGWQGLECLSGIPGLVGATPIQNVGAYGQEVGETITRVRAFDRDARDFVTLDRSACGFGYRASVFKRTDRWIVTGVRFELPVSPLSAPIQYAELANALGIRIGDRAPARTTRETVIALRRRKGMVLDPTDPDSVSAGSFFVNPVVDAAGLSVLEERASERPPRFDAGDGRYKLAAAWLVERAGFPKGWTRGRVGVSSKHALALINRGDATARELLAAARSIRDGVRGRFGVDLEPEPVLVGCSWEE
jgi:UDP-N-acetylmuramate dehydrogenase